MIPLRPVALARFAPNLAESADSGEEMAVVPAAPNGFSGLVSRVVRDTVMVQVEIQAGPHRFASPLSRGGRGGAQPAVRDVRGCRR